MDNTILRRVIHLFYLVSYILRLKMSTNKVHSILNDDFFEKVCYLLNRRCV